MAVLLRSLPLLLSALLAGQVLAADGPLVEVVAVKQMAVRDELITFGSLRSDESVMIRPEIEGRLATLHFREGQAVTAGDLLVIPRGTLSRAEERHQWWNQRHRRDDVREGSQAPRGPVITRPPDTYIGMR